MNNEKNTTMVRVLGATGTAATLAITPWFAYDPINLPKMLVLSTGAAFLASWLILNVRRVERNLLPLICISLLFVATLIVSFFTNSSPWYQQLWGVWGRSTGLITYLSFVAIMLVSISVASSLSLSFIRMIFERLGYVVTSYTLLQLLELDPINWSQKIMVATLGNINFMSSFLGLTAISYTSRFILEKQSITSKSYYFCLTALNLYLIFTSRSIQGVGVFLAGISVLIAFFVRRKLSFKKSLLLLSFTSALGLLLLLGTAGLGPLAIMRQDTVIFRIDYWRAGINMTASNPINGVGLDSYGDFYRDYRTLEAVTRTGQQRVTNTAHNIFLDVFAGAGMFAGILMILIMLITALRLVGGLKENNSNFDLPAFGGMWLGFLIFCLISINQIGVGVWGFIFTGLLNGSLTKSKLEQKDEKGVSKKGSTKLPEIQPSKDVGVISKSSLRDNRLIQAFFSAIVTLVVFIVTLLPNLADARYLNSVKASDWTRALDVIDDMGIQDFHRENLIERLAKEGLEDQSLKLALALTKENPQSWLGWIQIISNSKASREQQLKAAQNILRIDPFNFEARKAIEEAITP